RHPRGGRRQGARPHRRARVPELPGGARLLPLARLPGCSDTAQRQGRDGSLHHRGLRRPANLTWPRPAVRHVGRVAFLGVGVPLYRPGWAGEKSMSDMRLIVAGAGGRMGRTLIHAIAATDGATLAGAVDAPGSAVIGRDAGELAGLGRNGIEVAAAVESLLAG